MSEHIPAGLTNQPDHAVSSGGGGRQAAPMVLNRRVAGWCGVLAGVGLLVEGALWTASRWTPEVFADPTATITFFVSGGTTLRWAVLTGFVNLAFYVVFVGGLADRLRAATPTFAALSLLFGMIGAGIHSLVPFTHWYGVPAFLDAASVNRSAAEDAWIAVATVGHEAAGGAGSLFLGLSLLTGGLAIVVGRALPRALGWVGIVAGVSTLLTVFAPATPLSGLARAAFVPALFLAILFRIWGGAALSRPDDLDLAAEAPWWTTSDTGPPALRP